MYYKRRVACTASMQYCSHITLSARSQPTGQRIIRLRFTEKKTPTELSSRYRPSRNHILFNLQCVLFAWANNTYVIATMDETDLEVVGRSRQHGATRPCLLQNRGQRQ